MTCFFLLVVVVQLLSCDLFATTWTAALQASLSFYYLPKFAETHVHWVSDTIQLPHPLSCPSPTTFNLSQHQGLFKWVSSSHRWPKYWSFSFSISPSNEYLGLISFKIDWFDLLVVQGTLKSLLYLNDKINKNKDCLFSVQFSSVQFNCSVVSKSLQPHGL